MSTDEEKENSVFSVYFEGNSVTQSENSIEVIRKCNTQHPTDTSWEQSNYVSFKDSKESQHEKTPPFHSIMIDASPTDSRSSCSTQTDIVGPIVEGSLVDVNLSFTKDFNLADSSSNDNDADVERSLGSKRYRHDSYEEKEKRPRKKTKCTDSSTSSSSDLTEPKAPGSESSNKLCSESDVSFKSINTNYSYKTRKRRRKSDSNLFKDVLHRSRRCSSLDKYNYSGNNTPGGTPRKDKPHRRSNRTKVWNIMDICTWIGRKGYQSITGLYTDILREPITPKENKENVFVEEVKGLRNFVKEIDNKHTRLARENEMLQEQMKKMLSKIEELENKLSSHQYPQNQQPPPSCPPPPPPPPPPPLPPPPSCKPLSRAHTVPRCGSAPPRIAGPRLTITPQDIANVKLRKAKDNPVRPKPAQKDTQQPLVTQHMLEATRAKLGRNRPVAASTPKQQLSELEKCLLQESSVTSLYRRRVTRGNFRSAEELRVRPYPTRCARSPRSPRSNSLSRAPTSPPKFPLICPNIE